MRKLFIIIPIFLITLASAQDYAPGQVIVLLQPGTDIQSLINRYSGITNTAFNLHVDHVLSSYMNIWLLDFDAGSDHLALLNSIRQQHEVAAAQLNYRFESRNIPDDSLFGFQWNLNNISQTGGTFGADIDALRAWDLATGGRTANGDTIVIAVVDCGFDITHNDLSFWKNYKEIPGNGIDDDGDGYIDDYDGWNANGNDTVAGCSHGTTLCGIAGAKGNNRMGVAGVNWNAQIMPVNYITVTDASVITCYSYVMHMRQLYNETNGAKGAFIVATNSSFGLDYGKPADHPVWCAMYDSLGSVGILNAAAGPNLAIDVDSLGDMPTTCPSDWLIAVTNTTNKDQLYGNAGWGAINIDLGAPGTSILTTLPNNQYGYQSGTSMAAPHVAGTVALMWAAACDSMINDYKRNPALLALAMKNIMLGNVDVLPSLQGLTVSNGRLNIYRCLLGVQKYCSQYTGIQAYGKDTEPFLLYPNPSDGFITIDFPSVAHYTSLQITDCMGKTVSLYMNEKEQAVEGVKTIHLDVSSLAGGIYFVRLLNPEHEYSLTQKLVIE